MMFFKQHLQTGPTVVTGMTALMDNRFGTLTHDGFNCEWILRLMGANITVPTTRSGFPTLTGRYEQIHTYSPETLNGFTVIFQGGDPTVDAQWVQRHNRARFLRYMSFHRGPRLAQLAQDIVAGVDAEAAVDALQLRAVADVDAHRADRDAGVAVDAVALAGGLPFYPWCQLPDPVG